MRTISSLAATRRAALGGAVAVALMLTSACGSDTDKAAPEATETQPATDSSTSESDNHGDGDDETEQTVYELVEATSPTTLTLKSGSETVEVRLLGLADVKAEGETDTAFAPQEAIDAATGELGALVEGGDIVLVEDPAADDTDEDGALLRYVDLLDAGGMDRATGEKEDLDVALALIQNEYGDAGALGVYDPTLQDAGLERMEQYVEATRIALNPMQDGGSDLAYFDGLDTDGNGDPVWEGAELVVSV